MQNAGPLSACPANSSSYRWRFGDTLDSVAAAHETSRQAIEHVNRGVDFSRILPGVLICMPPATLTCPFGILYTVKGGDSFTSIARVFNVPAGMLADQNPYTDPRTLRPGQILCVPNGAGQEAPPATNPASACPPGYTRARVGFGQSLFDILSLYDISLERFRAANPALNLGRLAPGQTFCVPSSPGPMLCENGAPHTLRPGENLSSLSAATSRTMEALLRANPTFAPSDFVPGRTVCIPR